MGSQSLGFFYVFSGSGDYGFRVQEINWFQVQEIVGLGFTARRRRRVTSMACQATLHRQSQEVPAKSSLECRVIMISSLFVLLGHRLRGESSSLQLQLQLKFGTSRVLYEGHEGADGCFGRQFWVSTFKTAPRLCVPCGGPPKTPQAYQR